MSLPLLLSQANTLAQSGQSAEAIALYDEYLVLEPDNSAAWNNRGNALDDLQHHEAAITSFEMALAINPNYPQALCNKAVVLINIRRYLAALLCLDQCLAIDASFAIAHTNRGNVLRAIGRVEEAIESHDRAIALNPEFANAQWNQSLCRLLIGDYAQGWPQYEWRWKAPGPSGQVQATPRPTWLGKESIEGKRIVLWPEGGDGDVFQFARFAQVLKDKGAQVVLATRLSMISLFRVSFPNITLLPMVDGMEPPEFDFQSSLMSMPLACGIDSEDAVPAHVPYIYADVAKINAYAQQMDAKLPNQRRIGICWAGNPTTEEDNLRSLHLSQLGALLLASSTHGVQIISLQKGYAASQVGDWNTAHPDSQLVEFSSIAADWSDTAALIANLDLVITTCTSVAHLAGAMGKPTWVLVGRSAYWLWSTGRSDNVWYPTARLFRQPQLGDWDTVIKDVMTALSLSEN